jgi:simple sugar transport system substrate-binding protein
MQKNLFRFTLLVMVLALVLAACGTQPTAQPAAPAPAADKLKACFVYVGPIGDIGWTNAHDVGRRYVDDKYDWLETAYAESVPEADSERFIDRFVVEEKCKVVFTTSFGFMDATLAAAQKYPDNYFFHVSGYKRAPNMGTIMADFYQIYYLNGLMAGALTKSGKVGYVAAHPIPELVRHINAFTIGVREANPQATVEVNWIFAWYDPAKAREAAEALIANGVDVLAFTEDTATVVQVAEEYTAKGQPVYSFSHYSPMSQFGPNSLISGQLVDWGILYEDVLTKIHLGIYTTKNLENVDYWGLLSGYPNLGGPASVALGGKFGEPINPVFEAPLKQKKLNDPLLGEISVYDLVFKRIEQMKDPAVLFDPFTGPINNQEGALKIKPGQRLTVFELNTIDWFVEGVIGKANP